MRSSVLLCALGLAAAACPAPADPAAPRRRIAAPPPPRVRVGSFLRLQRAGVLRAVPRQGVAALVAPRHRAAGWQRAIDSQGNQFRVSPQGLIVTDGTPHRGRQPASVDNVAYYYTQAYALMAKGYRRQGLVMAAEILDLPPATSHVRLAQRSLCALFSRLGIRGVQRRKLYRNLVGVAHRVTAGARLTNHVHGFALTAPLSWQVMAATGGKLSPDATVMAFSLPRGPRNRIRANLLWTTRKLPQGTPLGVFARTRLLTTAGSTVGPASFGSPPALGPLRAYRVAPLKVRGRTLRSYQLFFAKGGLVHHLNLLLDPTSPETAPKRALARLLTTFARVTPQDRCR